MKLLYITNGINGSGGLERVLSIKASYLADHYGYDVTIMALNEAHLNPFYTFSSKINLISIPVTGKPWQYINAYIKGIRKIVDLIKPDIISVCDDGLKGFFVPKILPDKVHIIYERHVSKKIEIGENYSHIKKVLVKTKWALMENLGHSFSKFVVLTEGNKKEWKKLKNIKAVANPLSFYPTESSDLSSKKVICVGKQSYQKGQDILLHAWEHVSKKHPDWILELYGQFDSSLKLEHMASKLGIENSVRFYKPEKDIESKYLESSIYVMSSRFEGFGMVLIEAMACGLPCVSFDCNYGPSDIIPTGFLTYILENGNIKHLSSRLMELIENESLRSLMGKKAKENVKRYLPEIIVKEWDELFKSLVK